MSASWPIQPCQSERQSPVASTRIDRPIGRDGRLGTSTTAGASRNAWYRTARIGRHGTARQTRRVGAGADGDPTIQRHVDRTRQLLAGRLAAWPAPSRPARHRRCRCRHRRGRLHRAVDGDPACRRRPRAACRDPRAGGGRVRGERAERRVLRGQPHAWPRERRAALPRRDRRARTTRHRQPRRAVRVRGGGGHRLRPRADRRHRRGHRAVAGRAVRARGAGPARRLPPPLLRPSPVQGRSIRRASWPASKRDRSTP